jgi:hypothetical protein
VRLDDEAAARLEALYQFIDAIAPRAAPSSLIADWEKLRRLARSHVMLLCLREMQRETARCVPILHLPCAELVRTSHRAAYALRFREE